MIFYFQQGKKGKGSEYNIALYFLYWQDRGKRVFQAGKQPHRVHLTHY